MSRIKMLPWSVLFWLSLGTLAQADPLNWSYWSGSGDPVSGPSTNNFTAASPPPSTPPPSPSPASDPSQSSSGSTPSTAPSTGVDNGFINFGSGPYPEASLLISGSPQPFFNSPAVDQFFGGVPNASQQQSFENAVLKDVQTTFQVSGMNPSLTIDPNVPAAHTISVVSNASYPGNPNGIGITDVGHNGFSFIDKFAGAQSLTDLEWAVAHNVAHELMHSFGVAVHHDQTGQYLDAATATWALLTNPNTTFSAAAVADMNSHLNSPTVNSGSPGSQLIDGDLEIVGSPVPEPATVALWGVGAVVLVVYRRRSVRSAA